MTNNLALASDHSTDRFIVTLARVYDIGYDYISLLFFGTAALLVIITLYRSLRFNYYYYLKYGEVVIILSDGNDTDKKDKVKDLAHTLNLYPWSCLPWIAALFGCILIIFLAGMMSVLWPVALVVVVPMLLVRALGYRKRQKFVFQQCLKDGPPKVNADRQT